MNNQTKQAISVMLAAFPSSNTDPDLASLAFEIAIEGLPASRVVAAAKDYISGAVTRPNKAFAPSTAEFVAYVRSLPMSEAERAEYVAMHRPSVDTATPKQLAPRIGPNEPLTPEARARIMKLKAAFDTESDKISAELSRKRVDGPNPFEAANASVDAARGVYSTTAAPFRLDPNDPRLAAIPDRGEPYGFQKLKAKAS